MSEEKKWIISEEHEKWFESLTPEQFQALVDKQERKSKDAKDFGPYWLDGIQGSLAEERRQGRSNKDIFYNREVVEARRLLRKESVTLRQYLSNPDALNIKLSLLWSLYPSLEIFYKLDVTDICKRSSKLLRAFMFYFYSTPEDFNPWVTYEIECEFDRILESNDTCPISPRLLKELKIIRYIFTNYGSTEGAILLEQIYDEENLRRWIKTGCMLVDSYKGLLRIPYARTREKVRRRGYRESHSNKRKSKDQRGDVAMSSESRTLEEIKQDILRKQAILFEKRLDRYLELLDDQIPREVKKQKFRELLDPEPTSKPEDETNPWQMQEKLNMQDTEENFDNSSIGDTTSDVIRKGVN